MWFIALIKLSDISVYIKILIISVFVFTGVLFLRQLDYLWKNIARKRLLSNLGKILENEENINSYFLNKILEYYQKIQKSKAKETCSDCLKAIQSDIDFLLTENRVIFLIKSIWNLIKQYKLELMMSFVSAMIYFLTITL